MYLSQVSLRITQSGLADICMLCKALMNITAEAPSDTYAIVFFLDSHVFRRTGTRRGDLVNLDGVHVVIVCICERDLFVVSRGRNARTAIFHPDSISRGASTYVHKNLLPILSGYFCCCRRPVYSNYCHCSGRSLNRPRGEERVCLG